MGCGQRGGVHVHWMSVFAKDILWSLELSFDLSLLRVAAWMVVFLILDVAIVRLIFITTHTQSDAELVKVETCIN